MTQYRKLIVWEKSVSLTQEIYRTTLGFPKEEQFGLVAQMRRSSVSIASNLAEGCGRRSRRELIRFIDISYGSMAELETQLEISRRLGYVSDEEVRSLLRATGEVGRMLNGLRETLSRSV